MQPSQTNATIIPLAQPWFPSTYCNHDHKLPCTFSRCCDLGSCCCQESWLWATLQFIYLVT